MNFSPSWVVLSASLHSRDSLELVMDELTSLHIEPLYRKFFTLMATMYSEGLIVNPATLGRRMIEEKWSHEDSQLHAELSYGFKMSEDTLESSIQELKTNYLTENIKRIGANIAGMKSKGEELLLEVDKALDSCRGGGGKDFFSSEELIKEFRGTGPFMAYQEEKAFRSLSGDSVIEGLPTYYPSLDKLIGGLQWGKLTVIGARTSVGKTSWAIALMLNILKHQPDVPILFASLEMGKFDILEKIISEAANVPIQHIITGNTSQDERKRMMYHAQKLEKYPVTFLENFSLTVNQFRSKVKSSIKQKGTKLIFLDYLTKLKSSKQFNSNHLSVDDVSKGLQSLALETGTHIVVLSQLNRQVESREDKRPRLSDLRESGSIEEDCDTGLLLSRNPSNQSETIVEVGKNRCFGGILGSVLFSKESGIFSEKYPFTWPQKEKDKFR